MPIPPKLHQEHVQIERLAGKIVASRLAELRFFTVIIKESAHLARCEALERSAGRFREVRWHTLETCGGKNRDARWQG